MPESTSPSLLEPHPSRRPRVDHWKLPARPGAAPAHVSRFRGPSGVEDWQIVVTPIAAGSFGEHLAQVERGYHEALEAAGLPAGCAVWRRFFCSDIANQTAALRARPFANPSGPDEPCAISHVGQPPLPNAKLALWASHIHDPHRPLEKHLDGHTLELDRGTCRHLWTTNLVRPGPDPTREQSAAVFADFLALLDRRGLTLADNVVRTWIFQPYIDTGYQDMVEVRRAVFQEHGLTAQTHFIASTGIGGRHEQPDARVFIDAHAIAGLSPRQTSFLTASDHLGPTSAYGVTFERATAVSWADRSHVFVSGTASIDPKGRVVHQGNVLRQLDRTLGNIEALLATADTSLDAMAVFIVYLRDPGDHPRVLPALRERIGDAPLVCCTAQVCRPSWLIEIEGLACRPTSRPDLPAY